MSRRSPKHLKLNAAAVTVVECLESRCLLSAAPTDPAYIWSHLKPAAQHDLAVLEYNNPAFDATLNAELAELGIAPVPAQPGTLPDTGTGKAKNHHPHHHKLNLFHRKPTHLHRRTGPTAPTVTNINYYYDQALPNQLAFTFDQDVTASNWNSAVTIIDLNTGTTLAASGSYSSALHSVVYDLNASAELSDGNYAAILHGSQITDRTNSLPLVGSDSIAGHDFTTPFFFRASDFNHNRATDIFDLNALLPNYNTSGKSFSQGDSNYDGSVNIFDLNAILADYGTSLPLLTAPTGLTASPIDNQSVELDWPSSTDPTTTGFDVYRDSQILASNIQDTLYVDATAGATTTHTYMIVAKDAAGDSSYPSNIAVATTYALPNPTSVSATAVSAVQINLTWINSISNATAVNILRSTDGQNYAIIATLSPGSTSYSDTGLDEATEYDYGIQEVQSTATSGRGAGDTFTFPAAPTALIASFAGSEVDLSWSDNSSNESAYEIYRSVDGNAFTLIDSVGPDTSTYHDQDAVLGTTNYYKITGMSDGGESPATNTASLLPVGQLRLLNDDPTAPPWAQSRLQYTIGHGHTLTVTAAADGVLANDTDPNDRTLQIASHTQPTHGTLTLNSDGTFAYTANSGFVGADSFTYTATDDLSATSNTATVTINVTDEMPEAVSQTINLPAHFDDTLGYGGYGGYTGTGYDYSAQPVSGTLYASDANTEALTYSAAQPASGTLTLNSTTGSFTYTPASGAHGTVILTFTASDGIKTSNQATVLIKGWQVDYTQSPDGDNIAYDPIPEVGGNQSYSIFEDSAVQVDQPGLLAGAGDRDSTYPDPDHPAVAAIVEQPQHGSITHNDTTGAFTYTPNAGFTGRDWFTWQVTDGSKLGGYATVFIDVRPLDVSLSVDGLAPGDSSAAIPNQSENNSNWESHATLFLVTSAGLPNGSTVTLSLDSTTSADIQVWSGLPGGTGSTELFGNGVGGTSHTWTVGTDTIPASLDLLGASPTDYDQAQFALAVAPATQVVSGNPPASTQPTGNTAQATQPATVPGISGYLAAFDGSWDYPNNPGRGGDFPDPTNTLYSTAIYVFESQHYNAASGAKHYYRGVGNVQQHKIGGHYFHGAFGGPEAKAIVHESLDDLAAFYQDPTHWNIPVDIIGYSRGAFEAVKLGNFLNEGIPQWSTKYTASGAFGLSITKYRNYIPIHLRFVGLISPVSQMGPGQTSYWPTVVPECTGYLAQALDNNPSSGLYPQTTVTAPVGTQHDEHTFPYDHPTIGVKQDVLNYLIQQAAIVGAPAA